MEHRARKEGFSYDLACMCAIASASLWEKLEADGLKAEIVFCSKDMYFGHVIVYSMGYYIDTTATQFSGRRNKVTILSERDFDLQTEWFWQPQQFFQTANHLLSWQQETDWPEEQLCKQTKERQ
jgi:hypothetical protein